MISILRILRLFVCLFVLIDVRFPADGNTILMRYALKDRWEASLENRKYRQRLIKN